jgi:hypothetical protein
MTLRRLVDERVRLGRGALASDPAEVHRLEPASILIQRDASSQWSRSRRAAGHRAARARRPPLAARHGAWAARARRRVAELPPDEPRRRGGRDRARWPIAAHEFRFVAHLTTPGVAVRSLQAAGFTVESAWASDGRELDLTAEHSDRTRCSSSAAEPKGVRPL